jgi:hypothetical protein
MPLSWDETSFVSVGGKLAVTCKKKQDNMHLAAQIHELKVPYVLIVVVAQDHEPQYVPGSAFGGMLAWITQSLAKLWIAISQMTHAQICT